MKGGNGKAFTYRETDLGLHYLAIRDPDNAVDPVVTFLRSLDHSYFMPTKKSTELPGAND